MIFKDYANMTKLGHQCDMSSHKFGKLLVQAGLRTPDKVPSDFALRHELVKYVPNERNGALYPIWHAELTIKALKKLGLLPEGPVEMEEKSPEQVEPEEDSSEQVGTEEKS
ncbi:MAG: hypothetical protein JNM18_12490 [Planctomycetaceae bacterium]|nr:hypothetical protein [Planctomycetaceae bacterium]